MINGVARFAAAGQNEISFYCAYKVRFQYEVTDYAGNPPGVGWCDEDIGLIGFEASCIPVFQHPVYGHKLITRYFCYISAETNGVAPFGKVKYILSRDQKKA
jgi:hypothetical protein